MGAQAAETRHRGGVVNTSSDAVRKNVARDADVACVMCLCAVWEYGCSSGRGMQEGGQEKHSILM